MKRAGLVVFGLLTFLMCAPVFAASTLIIDNSSPGFSASANWKLGTSGFDKYGPDYRYYVGSNLTIYDPARWTPINASAVAGKYDISAWWSAGSNRTNRAIYTLPNGVSVYANQQINGGRWNLLGRSNVGTTGGSTKLSNTCPVGYIVIADAVKYYGPLF
jgi:hypothetical protein